MEQNRECRYEVVKLMYDEMFFYKQKLIGLFLMLRMNEIYPRKTVEIVLSNTMVRKKTEKAPKHSLCVSLTWQKISSQNIIMN